MAAVIFAASLSDCTKPVTATTTEDETEEEETTEDDGGIMMYVYVGDYVFIGITVPK